MIKREINISVFKKKPPASQKLSYWQSLTSSITNIGYGVAKQINVLKQKVFEPSDEDQGRVIIIQGKAYKNRLQAKQALNSILWFSYRKGFNIQDEYKSDVGWGCLIRVGQMALASALLNYFQSDKQIRKCMTFNSITENLIVAFSDFKGEQEKYSLNKIMQIAERQFNHKPGQWFDLTRISHCLRVAQNNFPMRGSENLQVVFFDQSINIPTIFKIESLIQCKCVKKVIVCPQCHSQIKQGDNRDILLKNKGGQFETLQSILMMPKHKLSLSQQSSKTYSLSSSSESKNNLKIFRNRKLKRDLFLLVLTRVSGNSDPQNVNQAIFSLLDMKICLGIMTGFPKKAIFVVGRQANKLIYLNPHYVQQNKNKQESFRQSYFCKQYLTTERTALDPSMTFCFYIQNLDQLEILTQNINNVNHLYPDSLSICFDFYRCPFSQSDYLEVEEDIQSENSYTNFNEDRGLELEDDRKSTQTHPNFNKKRGCS